MINPSGIPQFTGDFEQLDKDVSGLRSDAIGIRNGGMDVHSRFQTLGAYYTAPEADDLFATTQPVMDKADTFATKLETVADALDTFSIEARPLAKRLEQLKTDALAFVENIDGDEDWTQDEDKVHRNKELVDGATAAQFAFQEAERRAASKISKIVGGPTFVTDHGGGFYARNTVTYGYDLDLLKSAKELPWGSVDEQSYEAWSLGWFGHGAKSFVWDGIYHDGIEAGLSGLWTLVGGNGGDAAGDAWSGLKDVVTGIGLYTEKPYDAAMDWAFGPDKESADEIRAKKAAKEFGKSLVAWDQWQENPTRAAGTTVFNLLTLGAGPLGVVSKTSEVGAVAKGASVAAKVGEFLDPVSAGLKATGKTVSALPKLSDLTSRLLPTTKAGAADAHGVHSVIELEDGSKVLIKDGKFIAYDKNGQVIADQSKAERPGTGNNASEPTPTRQPAMAGAASRTPHVTAHAGDDLSPRASHEASASHRDGSDSHSRTGDVPSTIGRAGTGDGGASRSAGGGEHSNTGSSGNDGASPRGSKADWPEHVQRQVELANRPDKKWFNAHYGSDGRRLREDGVDEYGDRLTKLRPDPDHPGQWLPKIEKQAEPPKYHLGETVDRRRADATPENLESLDKHAHNRRTAIDSDQAFHPKVEAAEKAYAKDPTPENKELLRQVMAEHAPLHESMGKESEAFGERVAELQAIPDNYAGAHWVDLADTPTHADRFDQVWRLDDGRFVVVEAKSNITTRLGHRTLETGKKVSQGTREYFEDILKKMEERGRTNPQEAQAYSDLADALDEGKVEYVLVKGRPDGHTYAGYIMKKFNIGLPKGATGADTTAAP
ncbi:hypothetical protein ACFV29_39060 [Streptomyces sp. NPDC059690]|uniref:hypothetical protein n=1 Tax=Streptomyces sp. NPDC059690 TaxID=3346907 RepID=UPI0036979DB7